MTRERPRRFRRGHRVYQKESDRCSDRQWFSPALTPSPFNSSSTTFDTKSIKSKQSNSKMAKDKTKGKANDGDGDSCNTDSDIGSIGSNTFRENKRKEFADYENEDDEDLFNHHNNDVLQLFNNDHHNIMDDDDLNSAGSSLASFEGWNTDNTGGVLLSNMGIFGQNEFSLPVCCWALFLLSAASSLNIYLLFFNCSVNN